jgi:hypothetical protein
MPGLDYPFVFECSNCSAETTVERSDAHGLHPDPNNLHAIDMVLEDRGWVRDDIDQLIFCPGCRPREA